jgi:hypothetical protein
MELATKVNGLLGVDIPWHLKASYEAWATMENRWKPVLMGNGESAPNSTGLLYTARHFPWKSMAPITES